MPRHEILDEYGFHNLGILRFENWLEIDRVQIATLFGEVTALVENVSHAATHASGKISAAGSEHQYQAPGHVFATMDADAFDHSGRSGVANRKALASDTVEKRFAAGCAVEGNVADQNIFLGGESGSAGRIHHQPSTGQTLADVIVGLAFERKRDSLRQERAQALPRRSFELNPNRVVGQ